MKKAKTLRAQITIIMTILVALQSAALVLCLLVSQVFTILDAESVRLFYDTVSNRAQYFDNVVGELVANIAGETQQLNSELREVAEANQITPSQLCYHETGHEEAMEVASLAALNFLNNNAVTGAFVALEGSFYRGEGQHAHEMVYIRSNTPSMHVVDYTHYMLEMGPAAFSQEHQIPMSSGWALDYVSEARDYSSFFVHNPMDAALEHPGSEIERYGYWTNPSDILGDGVDVVTYTMPLLDGEGVPYGVFGFELSLQYITQEYMPSTELPFDNSFYAIAGTPQDGRLEFDWFIPSGTVAQIYLGSAQSLSLSSTRHQNLQQTSLPELGAMFVSAHELEMYSRNSPFADNGWSMVAFVGVDALTETSSNVQQLLIGSVILTTLIALVGVFLLSFASTRKIRGLSSSIRRINRYDEISIPRTGFAEVDELIQAVETLNASVISGSKRISKIMELTDMPIGCYEILENEVHLTDLVNQLLGFEAERCFTLAGWQEMLQQITARPEPGMENVYEWQSETGTKWLRVLQTETSTGTVGLIIDVSDEIRTHKQLSHKLDYDAMTGLYNRTAFKREAHAKIEQGPDGCGAMIFADLDNLKFINDTHGHESGDILLKRAGEIFARLEEYGAVVARIAGDEFAMYLHGAGDRAATRKLVYDVFDSIAGSTMTTPDGKMHRIRYSAGIAWYPEDARNVTDLLKLADYAMYEAKHHRKGTMVEFNPATYKETAYLFENRETISRLLDEQLIRFDFQPIVHLGSGKVFGYEALMRSCMEEFKSPMDILSVATAQSKLYQLEKLVAKKLYAWADEQHEALGGMKLFMNSLPSQPVTEDDMRALQQKYPNAAGRIVVEITEDENTSVNLIRDKVDVIRRFGGQIAIDDFGAGYSNELRILALEPDYVKIDMGIIRGVDTDADKQQLVESIVSFCKNKGITTIAEGVENKEELTAIVRLGVDMMQGYYTGRPAPEPQAIYPEAQAYLSALLGAPE